MLKCKNIVVFLSFFCVLSSTQSYGSETTTTGLVNLITIAPLLVKELSDMGINLESILINPTKIGQAFAGGVGYGMISLATIPAGFALKKLLHHIFSAKQKKQRALQTMIQADSALLSQRSRLSEEDQNKIHKRLEVNTEEYNTLIR